ncbi:MAG: LiaF transmembrane domain-containing protein [Candidatus Limnocylindrales bacterium]
MNLDRRFLNWGIFLILLGALPLAVQQGVISRDVLSGSWRFWPLVLVGIGVGLLLRRTPFDFAGGLIVAATFGLIFGGLLAVGPGHIVGCTGTVTSFDTSQGSLSGPGHFELHQGCGDMTVDTAAGNGWTMKTGNSEGRHAQVDTAADGVTVHASGGTDGWFGVASGRDDWRLTVPTGQPIDLGLEVNAGTARLDLANTQLTSASLTVNAGEARLDLGSAASVGSVSATVNAGSAFLTLPAETDSAGSLTVNAGGLSICAPVGLGLDIVSSQSLGGTNFGSAGLVRGSDDSWQSPDYASAAHHARLTITVNIGGVTLNPSGGCK